MPADAHAPFPARDHDHAVCLEEALGRAEELAIAKGVKWTALRRQVFRQIAQGHKPVSAYELIEAISREGKRIAPVSVYRILDVLQEIGLVHRLESRNAFFACMNEHHDGPQSLVLVCESCERVAETEAPEALSAIVRTAKDGQFEMRRAVVEVSGICGDCGGEDGH